VGVRQHLQTNFDAVEYSMASVRRTMNFHLCEQALKQGAETVWMLHAGDAGHPKVGERYVKHRCYSGAGAGGWSGVVEFC